MSTIVQVQEGASEEASEVEDGVTVGVDGMTVITIDTGMTENGVLRAGGEVDLKVLRVDTEVGEM